jgi:hypothetical protein
MPSTVGSESCLFSLLVSTAMPIWFIFSAWVDGMIVQWDQRESGASWEVETGSWGGMSELVLALTIAADMATTPDAWLLPEMSDDMGTVGSWTEAGVSDGWANVV